MFIFSMLKGVLEIAQQIAAKSPVAVQGTKKSLVYSRDHSVQEGLDHIVNAFLALLFLNLCLIFAGVDKCNDAAKRRFHKRNCRFGDQTEKFKVLKTIIFFWVSTGVVKMFILK